VLKTATAPLDFVLNYMGEPAPRR